MSIASVAIQYLDSYWAKQGKEIVTLKSMTPLWHGGIIGPSHPMVDGKMLWTTKNPNKKHLYDDQARATALVRKVIPYFLDLELSVDLELANFNAASMSAFCEQFCNYQHGTMKEYLLDWISILSLDGLIAINGDADEVAVCQPETNLRILSSKPL